MIRQGQNTSASRLTGIQIKKGSFVHAGVYWEGIITIQSSHTNKQQNSPYPSTPLKYGAKIQYAQTPANAPLVGKADKKHSTCLFYGRTVDSTILTTLNTITF